MREIGEGCRGTVELWGSAMGALSRGRDAMRSMTVIEERIRTEKVAVTITKQVKGDNSSATVASTEYSSLARETVEYGENLKLSFSATYVLAGGDDAVVTGTSTDAGVLELRNDSRARGREIGLLGMVLAVWAILWIGI